VPVVGPSGVGKDSVLAYAATELRNDADMVFVRRTVTRPTTAGGEDFIGVTEKEFTRLVENDAFCLHWPAHGLHYGIPMSASAAVDAGKVVVANLSRGMIAAARERFPRTLPIAITAPRAIVEQRLRSRGREDDASIALRLARLDAWQAEENDLVKIDNSGSLEMAGMALVTTLRGLAAR